MKKSYKKIYILDVIVLIILIINSIIYNFLNTNNMILLLITILIIFKLLLGYEKDNHRYTKTIILDLIVILLIYFIIYYLIGVLTKFAKPSYFMQIKIIIPIILIILLKEFLRYQMLIKSNNNKLLLILSNIVFILFDITNSIYIINSRIDLIVLITTIIIPSISNNIFLSYLSLNTGYKPNMLYLLILTIYPYVVLLIPNPSIYIITIINFIFPIILTYRYYLFFNKKNSIVSYKKNSNSAYPIITSIIVIILIYFVSGYFNHQAIVIVSDSMNPVFYKGDIVIIKKDLDYQDYREGDILAHQKGNNIVIHRIIKIINYKNEITLYTKGDANSIADNYKIVQEDIVGKMIYKIPYIGYPTVWLREILN